MAVIYSERRLTFCDCPVHPLKILEAAREEVRCSGIYFTASCSKDCGRYENCPWCVPLFIGAEKPPKCEDEEAKRDFY